MIVGNTQGSGHWKAKMGTQRSRRPPGNVRTKLEMFLSGSHRSTSREYILTTRLIHDLTVAAVARGYDLLVYLPTVDSDGFDVILDDRDRLVPIQVKSIVEGG